MPLSLRSALKVAAESALVWTGGAWLHRQRMSGRVLVLAYHNVVPDGVSPGGDRPNHLPLSAFARQIASLHETHDFVALADTLAPRSGGRPRVAVTFDDAYRGAVRHAVPELVRQGVPATLFVAPGYLGGRTFWWDALAAHDGGLNGEVRSRALSELRGEHAAVIQWARSAGVSVAELSGDMCSASEQEVVDASRQPGITLGSHTWGHPNLARLQQDELAAELVKPIEWLRDRAAHALPWIAYPYGAFNGEVLRASAAAGYAAGLAIDGGWIERVPRNRLALPRVNIPPGLSANGFAIRAGGMLCR